MKQTIFFLSLLCSLTVFAQKSEYSFFYSDNYLMMHEVLDDTSFFNNIKRNSVSEIKTNYLNSKYSSTETISFDSIPRPKLYISSSKKYFLSKQYFYDENHPDKYSAIYEYGKNNKELNVRKFKYNENGREVYYESYRKGKLNNKVFTTYNDKGQVIERAVYHKKSDVPKTRYEYDFYEDKSQKETRFYKKGKLKYTWYYDCEPKGALEQAHKDTSTVCVKQELDSLGRKIYWRQETDSDNRIITTRIIYSDTSNKKIAESLRTYSNGDTLTYWKKNINEFIYKQYDKGKITWEQHTKYNSFGEIWVLISSNYKRGKLKYRNESSYYYNEMNLLSRKEYINSKGKISKTTYEYRFR